MRRRQGWKYISVGNDMYPNFGIVIRIKVCLDVCPNLTHHKDLSPYPQATPFVPRPGVLPSLCNNL